MLSRTTLKSILEVDFSGDRPSLMNLNFKQNGNKDNEVLKMHMRNRVSYEFLKKIKLEGY